MAYFEIPKELLNQWRNFHLRNIKIKNDWLNNNEGIINSDKYKNIFKHSLSSNLINLITEFKDKHIDENTNCATRKASELSIEFFNKQIK